MFSLYDDLTAVSNIIDHFSFRVINRVCLHGTSSRVFFDIETMHRSAWPPQYRLTHILFNGIGFNLTREVDTLNNEEQKDRYAKQNHS